MIKYDASNKPSVAFEIGEWRLMMIHLQIPDTHVERAEKLAHFIAGLSLEAADIAVAEADS